MRRHIEGCWRDASIQFGFQEIDGPTYEHLDLYTVKSGPGIVSELFNFKRSGGDTDYALRPEFTPTLARMAVAKGNAPVPTKWFSMPCLFRAERPQRGRLREHFQWNVDILGLSNADTDAELISVAIAGLQQLGLDPSMVQVKYSHRDVVAKLLTGLGVTEAHLPAAFDLLDKRDKMPAEVFTEKASELGLDSTAVEDSIDWHTPRPNQRTRRPSVDLIPTISNNWSPSMTRWCIMESRTGAMSIWASSGDWPTTRGPSSRSTRHRVPNGPLPAVVGTTISSSSSVDQPHPPAASAWVMWCCHWFFRIVDCWTPNRFFQDRMHSSSAPMMVLPSRWFQC